jgi:hypothetical protein
MSQSTTAVHCSITAHQFISLLYSPLVELFYQRSLLGGGYNHCFIYLFLHTQIITKPRKEQDDRVETEWKRKKKIGDEEKKQIGDQKSIVRMESSARVSSSNTDN